MSIVLAGNLSSCELSREEGQTQRNEDKTKAVHVPDCDLSGKFTELQCNEITGHCWCVDSDGNMTKWADKNEDQLSYCKKGKFIFI